jgi:RNA exonuclease 4
MKRARPADEKPCPAAHPPAVLPGGNWAALQSRLKSSQREASSAPKTAALTRAAVAPPPYSLVAGGGAPRDAPLYARAAPPAAAAAGGGGAAAASAPPALAAARACLLGPFDPAAPLSREHEKYVAVDCEMVGVGEGGHRSALARVVAVDYLGRVLLNTFVKPSEAVSDYRTFVSGVTAAKVKSAPALAPVQAEVARLLKGKVLVGHGLKNDLRALLLSHGRRDTRDTALYRPFCRRRVDGVWGPRRLKHLVKEHLGVDIQQDGVAHDPAEDARAALALYRLTRVEWEHALLEKGRASAPKKLRAGEPTAS